MSQGSETDPEARLADLQKRRGDIDAEMARVRSGDMPLLDDTALKDRFQQFTGLARELLTDFRELEHNFRGLDRRLRERIALWDGATLDDALALIGNQKEASRFAGLVQVTAEHHAALLPWLQKRPLQALALADSWNRLLAIVYWLRAHPRPGIYLRQVDMAGVDSKFIEAHRGVLSELLDMALPAQAIEHSASGLSQFSRRYGLLDKPLRIRFRLLDERLSLLTTAQAQDISLTQAAFAQLDPPLGLVFITKNEVNSLPFRK